MGRPLRMVSSIFQSFNPRRFESLIGIRQFLDTFVVSVLNGRKPLRPPGLAGTIRPNLSRITSKFIGCGFVVFWVSLLLAIWSHEFLLRRFGCAIPVRRRSAFWAGTNAGSQQLSPLAVRPAGLL